MNMLFYKLTGRASHLLGPPFGYSIPSALSCTEQAHIPELRGGAPRALSSMVRSELRDEMVMVLVELKGE